MGLDQRINRAVWHNDAEALAPGDYDTIFTLLWDDLGRDYIRRAWRRSHVRDQRHADRAGIGHPQHTAGLAQAALARAAHGGLYRQIGRLCGSGRDCRRLGAANRYGAGGRWGKVMQMGLSRACKSERLATWSFSTTTACPISNASHSVEAIFAQDYPASNGSWWTTTRPTAAMRRSRRWPPNTAPPSAPPARSPRHLRRA